MVRSAGDVDDRVRRRQRYNQHAGPSWQIMASLQWQACGTEFLLAVPARALPADARGVTPEFPLAGHAEVPPPRAHYGVPGARIG